MSRDNMASCAHDSLTERLAETLVAQNVGADSESVAIAHKAVVDTVACVLAGSSSAVVHALLGVVTTGPSLPAAVFGLGTRAAPVDAALLSATAAHSQELDDYSLESMGHPSAVIVPALLAVAEHIGANGDTILKAYSVGYAATLFFGSFLRPPHHFAGFPTCALGATTAVSTMLGADTAELRTALGIAATLCSEVRANFGTSAKPVMCGRASAAGVLAAELAHAGVDASASVLEAPGGVLGACIPDHGDAAERALALLAEGAFAPSASPPILKKFASCGGTHSAIEAALRLRPSIEVSAIDKIIVAGPAYYQTSLRYHRPASVAEAKFSAEASVAIALTDGAAGVAQFTDESLARPQVQALIARSQLVSDERLSRVYEEERTLPAAVRVTTPAGDFDAEVLYPPGTAALPMSLSEVFDKLDACIVFAHRKVDDLAVQRELFSLHEARSIEPLATAAAGS